MCEFGGAATDFRDEEAAAGHGNRANLPDEAKGEGVIRVITERTQFGDNLAYQQLRWILRNEAAAKERIGFVFSNSPNGLNFGIFA